MHKLSSGVDQIRKVLDEAGFKENLIARTIRDIIEGNQKRYLNKYRGALSLWAESFADTKQKIVVTLDGRDTAGKGSNIKRVTEYLDLKCYGVRAFGVPTAEEKFKDNWFQRYMDYFPGEGRIRFFDRSWYNRAGVEAAMGFCTQEEYDWFMKNVNDFEQHFITEEGFDFIKVYLSIRKKTQKERLQGREKEMKRWKSSFIDKQAQEKWNAYTLAKMKILEHTDSEHAPWMVLDSNAKFLSAVEIMKAIIRTSQEVASTVETTLSIDLSPNRKIVRTVQEELERMKKSGEIEEATKGFHFAESKAA